MTWKPISTYPENTPYFYILCHKEYKWVRFGRKYPPLKDWYYSGTNERSQWAQTIGDEPTHWDYIPELPK